MSRSSWCLLVLVVGCASTRSATVYDGDSEPAIAAAPEVVLGDRVPNTHVELGTVSAKCTLVETSGDLEGEWLSNVDCSASRLTRALMERAAHEGGDRLVGLVCKSRAARGDDPKRTPIWCRATVARPGEGELWARPAELDPVIDPTLPPASEAWNIRVRFTRAKGSSFRGARRSDLVQEFARMPVNYVPLGDLHAWCASGCSQAVAREGVREAGGRMGAHAVVRVECVARSDGWSCSGTAAGFEVDPDADPEAR